MEIEDVINFAKLEKTILVCEEMGDTFRPEPFYNKQIRISENTKHHELMTELISKYFKLKFVGKIEVKNTVQKGLHYLYELHPKNS